MTKLDDISDQIREMATDVATLNSRMGVVELYILERREAGRHWLRFTVASIVGVALLLLSAYVGAQFAAAQQPGENMSEQQIAEAITSGMIGPAIGAVLVLVAWISAKVREGVSLREQFMHALPTMRAAAVAAAGTVGLALMSGVAPMPAIAAGLAVLLALLNLRASKAQ